MTKRITRIRIESIEVSDDYVIPAHINDLSQNYIQFEADGHTFIGAERGKDFMFYSFDTSLYQVNPALQFIYWTEIAWNAFYREIPKSLKDFMFFFNNSKLKNEAVEGAKSILNRQFNRRDEVRSRMVNFAHWDPEIFDPTKIYWSVN